MTTLAKNLCWLHVQFVATVSHLQSYKTHQDPSLVFLIFNVC